jgi:hypothetical protein
LIDSRQSTLPVRRLIPRIIVYNQTAIDIGKYVQSMTISRSVDYPAGNMTFSLNPTIITDDLNTGDQERDNLGITNDSVFSYWKQLLRLYVPISGTIDGENNEEHTFVGLITQAHESIFMGSQRIFRVTCVSLLPKILMSDQIVISQALMTQNIEEIAKTFPQRNAEFWKYARGADDIGGNIFVGQPPTEAIKWIIKHAIVTQKAVVTDNMGIAKEIYFKDDFFGFYTPPDGTSKIDFDRLQLENKVLLINMLDNEYLFNPELTTYTGTLLNYIMSCLDNFFYEIFFDTVTVAGRPYDAIIIRSKPFSYKKVAEKKKQEDCNFAFWEDLPIIETDSRYRISENLGINESEVFNYFQLTYANGILAPSGGTLERLAINFPIIFPDMVQKFGLRELRAESKMALNWEKISQDIVQANISGTDYQMDKDNLNLFNANLLIKREKLPEWYAFPYFESGQISLMGNEKIKIGCRLFYLDKAYSYILKHGSTYRQSTGIGMQYYIKEASHSYMFPNLYSTNLSVTRGQPLPTKDFPDGLVPQWYLDNEPNFVRVTVINPVTPDKFLDDPEQRKLRQEIHDNMYNKPTTVEY